MGKQNKWIIIDGQGNILSFDALSSIDMKLVDICKNNREYAKRYINLKELDKEVHKILKSNKEDKNDN